MRYVEIPVKVGDEKSCKAVLAKYGGKVPTSVNTPFGSISIAPFGILEKSPATATKPASEKRWMAYHLVGPCLFIEDDDKNDAVDERLARDLGTFNVRADGDDDNGDDDTKTITVEGSLRTVANYGGLRLRYNKQIRNTFIGKIAGVGRTNMADVAKMIRAAIAAGRDDLLAAFETPEGLKAMRNWFENDAT